MCNRKERLNRLENPYNMLSTKRTCGIKNIRIIYRVEQPEHASSQDIIA